MPSGGARKRKQLHGLFLRQKGLCHWCKEKMLPPGSYTCTRENPRPPKNLCTLEHMFHKLHPERGKHGGEYVNVAACWRCNNERNRIEQAAMPIEILHQQSKGGIKCRP